MPVLNTPGELIAATALAPAVDDPIAGLEHRGYTLGPEMSRQWIVAQKSVKPKAAAAPGSIARPPEPLTFTTGRPSPPASPNRAPGDYNFILGIRSELANEPLSAFYESGTVPHEMELDELLSAGDLASLAAFFIVDRRGGTVSHLLITSAPIMETIPDGRNFVAVNIPVRLHWDRVTHFGGVPGRSTVTFATGTLRLIVQVQALISPGAMSIGLKLFSPLDSPAKSPRLILDPGSPVQRVPPVPPESEIDLLAVAIESALRRRLQDSLVWTVSPVIPLSIGSIQIQQLDVSSVGDALIASLNLDGTDGDVSTFVNLLPDDNSNIFLRTLDTVARQLIQIALQNGTLTALAKEQCANAEIFSASAHFEPGADFSGHLVDECPLNVDLNFNARRTIKVEFDTSQISGSQIQVTTTALGTNIGTLIFDKAKDALFNPGDPAKPTPIDLTAVIPGTDRLPIIRDASFAIEDGALIITARAGTRLDDLRTYLYARFLVPHLSFHDGTPLVGAQVRLMDQDAPAPAGGDVSLPSRKVTHVKDGIATTTLTTYEPPTKDILRDERLPCAQERSIGRKNNRSASSG